MDDNLSLRTKKNTDMNDNLIVQGGQSTAATYSNNGKKSQLTNNFMTPAGASNTNLLRVSPTKMPQAESTSNLGINNALDTSTFSA